MFPELPVADSLPIHGPNGAHFGPETGGQLSMRPRIPGFGFDWRASAASGLYHSGLLRAGRAFSRTYELQSAGHSRRPKWSKVTTPKFLILCYHRVGLGGIPIYSQLSPETFESQMRFLKKNYRIVSLQQVCHELQEPSTLGPAVAITFDDGYSDLFTHALPVLRKYEIPATIYLIAACMETGQVAWYDRLFLALKVAPAGKFAVELEELRSFHLDSGPSRLAAALEIISFLRRIPNLQRKEWCRQLEERIQLPLQELDGRILTWEQVHLMQHAGVSFGSHTVSHPVMSRLTPSELEFEIGKSKKMLEAKLSRPVEDFAFPFGHPADCGAQAAEQLVRCGYRSAVTTVAGINVPGGDPLGLHRLQICEEDTAPMFAARLFQLLLRAGSAPPSAAIHANQAPHPRPVAASKPAMRGSNDA
jgi:peptidoglycan/xylan/chitin deacetylase (PgdA/CDA1 family)